MLNTQKSSPLPVPFFPIIFFKELQLKRLHLWLRKQNLSSRVYYDLQIIALGINLCIKNIFFKVLLSSRECK